MERHRMVLLPGGAAGLPEGGPRALLIGAILAPVFLWVPYLGLVGWFLGALVHELGHTLAAWVSGRPAVPAISLGAEAATVHGEPSIVLALSMLGACCWMVWTFLVPPLRNWVLGAVLVLQPLIAWTVVGELFHLFAGHWAELAFGGIFLYRAWTAVATHGEAERILYGVLGCYFVLENAVLTLGLAFSEAARDVYRGNGSFGLRNDYIRVAEDVLGWRLETLALVATLPAVLVAVGAFWPLVQGWIRAGESTR